MCPMEKLQLLADEIEKRYGTVKRARGTFLYTAKGVRLTDMYLEGGRAILGWGGCSAYTQLKNVLSRGLTGSFNTDFDRRLCKAVSALSGDSRTVYAFSSYKAALAAAVELSKDNLAVWHPWSGENLAFRAPVVLLEPPLAWVRGITLLAVKTEFEIDSAPAAAVKLSPVMCEAVTRSVYDIIKAVPERQEKQFFLYDTVLTKYWTREGPWLTPKIPQEKYDDFVLHCLDCALVVNPFYSGRSIVPFGADKGVFGKLKNSSFSC